MQELLKKRTKRIGIEVILLADKIPNTSVGRAITNQIVRCATSVGANYRAACRVKSTVDFIYKLKIVEEEADETLYWLEMIEESGLIKGHSMTAIKKEVDEIIAIVVSSIRTMRLKLTEKP